MTMKKLATIDTVVDWVFDVLIIVGLCVSIVSTIVFLNPELVVGTISNANAIELAHHAARIENTQVTAILACAGGIGAFIILFVTKIIVQFVLDIMAIRQMKKEGIQMEEA